MRLGGTISFKVKNLASSSTFQTLRITPEDGQSLTPEQIRGIIGTISFNDNSHLKGDNKVVSRTHYAIPITHSNVTVEMGVSHPAIAGKKLKIELVGPPASAVSGVDTTATGGTVLDSFTLQVNPHSPTITGLLKKNGVAIPNGSRIELSSTHTERIYDTSTGNINLNNVVGAYSMDFDQITTTTKAAHVIRIKLVGNGGLTSTQRLKLHGSGTKTEAVRALDNAGAPRSVAGNSAEYMSVGVQSDQQFVLVFPEIARNKTFLIEVLGPYPNIDDVHGGKGGSGSGSILQTFFIDFSERLGELDVLTAQNSDPIPEGGLDVISAPTSSKAGTPAQMRIVNTVAANKYIVRLTQKTGASISSRGAQANDIWNAITFDGGQPTHRGGNYAIYERTGATGTKELAVSNFFRTLIGSASFNFELIGPYLSTETTPRDATGGADKRVAQFDVFVDWDPATRFVRDDDDSTPIGRVGGYVSVDKPETPFSLKYRQDSSNYLLRLTFVGTPDEDGRIRGFNAAQRTAAFAAIGFTCTGGTCPAKVATATHTAQRLASGVTKLSIDFTNRASQRAEYLAELIRGTDTAAATGGDVVQSFSLGIGSSAATFHRFTQSDGSTILDSITGLPRIPIVLQYGRAANDRVAVLRLTLDGDQGLSTAEKRRIFNLVHQESGNTGVKGEGIHFRELSTDAGTADYKHPTGSRKSDNHLSIVLIRSGKYDLMFNSDLAKGKTFIAEVLGGYPPQSYHFGATGVGNAQNIGGTSVTPQVEQLFKIYIRDTANAPGVVRIEKDGGGIINQNEVLEIRANTQNTFDLIDQDGTAGNIYNTRITLDPSIDDGDGNANTIQGLDLIDRLSLFQLSTSGIGLTVPSGQGTVSVAGQTNPSSAHVSFASSFAGTANFKLAFYNSLAHNKLFKVDLLGPTASQCVKVRNCGAVVHSFKILVGGEQTALARINDENGYPLPGGFTPVKTDAATTFKYQRNDGTESNRYVLRIKTNTGAADPAAINAIGIPSGIHVVRGTTHLAAILNESRDLALDFSNAALNNKLFYAELLGPYANGAEYTLANGVGALSTPPQQEFGFNVGVEATPYREYQAGFVDGITGDRLIPLGTTLEMTYSTNKLFKFIASEPGGNAYALRVRLDPSLKTATETTAPSKDSPPHNNKKYSKSLKTTPKACA